MKYITQDWTSTKDGYLFFVQRLQEMLFHYSDDIVKAPVHNTQTLLEEYVDTEKDVVKGSIKQYQLDIIAKEIKSSLMTDVIVRELYKYEVIEEMAKFLDKDQRTAVHYIFNKIPKKKYYEICCKYLKENLSESNRKTEIEKGLRAWLAFLLWHGYSSEYIYRFLRNIFEESINDPEKKAQIFLNRFDFEIGKYKVYFVFYEKLKPYQKLLNERLHISFEDDGWGICAPGKSFSHISCVTFFKANYNFFTHVLFSFFVSYKYYNCWLLSLHFLNQLGVHMFYKPWFCRFLQRFFRGKPGDTAVLVGFYGDNFLRICFQQICYIQM